MRDDVLAALREGVRRAVHRCHPGGAAGQRREGETARVAEDVEHAPALRERAHEAAVVALVEVEPRFLPGDRVDAVADAVLDDGCAPRQRAGRDARSRGEPLEGTDFGVRAFVDAGHVRHLRKRSDDRVTPALAARGRELHHHDAAVAIRDDPGKPVGLPVHEAGRIVLRVEHRRAQRGGMGDTPCDERRVDRLVRIEAPHARADLRGRRVRGECERLAVRGRHRDGIADIRLADDAIDRAREDPRMAKRDRPIARWLENDGRTAPGAAVSRGRHRTGGRSRT